MLPVTPQEIDAPDEPARVPDHRRRDYWAGNGYSEPREQWIECSCGAHVWEWQQYYNENPTSPDDAWAAHLREAFPDEPRRVEPDTAFLTPDEWAYKLETARRDQKVHDECGPDRAAF